MNEAQSERDKVSALNMTNLTDRSFPDHTTATGQEPTLSWMLAPKALCMLAFTPPPRWTLAPTSIQGSLHAHLYLKTKTHAGITTFKTKTRIVYSELALCHSTRLCGQTLRRAENTFGLCVHWVAPSPPRIERQWG